MVYQICKLVIYSGSLSKYCLYSSYSIQHSHRSASVSVLLIFHFFLIFCSIFSFVFNTLIITLLQFLGLWHSILCFCCGLLHSFGFQDVVYVVVLSFLYALFCFWVSLVPVLFSHSTCHVSLSWDYYQLCSHLFPFPSLPVVCI